MDRVKIFLAVLALLVVGVIVLAIFRTQAGEAGPNKYDGFAQCLKDSGATFYGAFWCPHCREQKKMFGSSVKLLPYVECSTLDGKSQLQVCRDKNIEGYPTWEFADGSRLSGKIPFEQLAEKTSCALPQE